MPRRSRPPIESPRPPSPRPAKNANQRTPPPALGERTDQLVQLCDYCSSAHSIADAHGEKLLAYLLAMAIQESQTALRRLAAAQAMPRPE